MKVRKGDVLTFRLRVEDADEAGKALGEFVQSMGDAKPWRGCVFTASSRGDVFKEREEADAILEDCAAYLQGHLGDEDAEALLDRIELPPLNPVPLPQSVEVQGSVET